ncbi:hypothetical protein M426DRAFT_11567 [Hypoxylon sp. CI-4A]|nr:hypothetical protein M426DRAFT_11567 [Hypoxylon sp. CI-4A]
MAIESRFERPQSFHSIVGIRRENEEQQQQQQQQQRYERWPIYNQLPPPVQRLRLPALFETKPLTPSHESRVQWFACQLSKATLRRYLSSVVVVTTVARPTPMPMPLPRGGARLELLPQDVIDRICSYVPYEDLLRLHQESAALQRVVNPHLASHDSKLSFVLRAERDFPQHRRARNLGCYMCFRVLPADFFASNQALQAKLRAAPEDAQVIVNLRRFCIYCGIQSGCHSAGDELNTRGGGRLWLCDCLRVLDGRTPGCKECKALCPLIPRGSDDFMSLRRVRE